MFARRKLILNQTNTKRPVEDDDIEELSDDEIDEIFELRQKGKKSIYENKLRIKKKDKKEVEQKSKNSNCNNSQIATKLNDSLKCSSDHATCDDDDVISLSSETDGSIIESDGRTTTNKNQMETDDEIILCSNPSSPVKSSSSRTKLILSSPLSECDFDPSLFPASFNYVKTIRVKFRYKGTYHVIPFKSTDKFKDKLEEIGEKLQINTSKMILMFDNKTIPYEETPDTLNITVIDIIDVYDKKEDENLVEENDDPNLFKIKFRDCDSRKKVQDVLLSMNRYDTFENVFCKYAEIKQLKVDQIIFEFDGEKMSADDKPEDLDMESDSLIDVKLKKK